MATHSLSLIYLNMSIMSVFMLYNIQQKVTEEIKAQVDPMNDMMKFFRSQIINIEKESSKIQQQNEHLSPGKKKLQEAVEDIES